MQKLSQDELAAVMQSPETLATYLVSLTPAQIDQYLSFISADTTLPPDIRKTLVKLFTQVRAEAASNQTLIEKELMPLAVGIATAMKLLQQIEALEAVSASL